MEDGLFACSASFWRVDGVWRGRGSEADVLEVWIGCLLCCDVKDCDLDLGLVAVAFELVVCILRNGAASPEAGGANGPLPATPGLGLDSDAPLPTAVLTVESLVLVLVGVGSGG